MRLFERLLAGVLGLLGALAMLATQVSAESAKSNVESWLKLVGFDSLAAVVPASADAWGIRVAFGLLIAAGVLWLLSRQKGSAMSSDAAANALTEPTQADLELRRRGIEAQEIHNAILTAQMQERQQKESPYAIALREHETESARIALRIAEAARLDAMSAKQASPRENWLALADTYFEMPRMAQFAPEFMPPNFLDSCLADSLDAPPVHPGMTFNPGCKKYRASNGFALVLCKVIWDRRQFEWAWAKGDRSTGFSLHPWQLENDQIPLTFVSDEVWNELRKKARFAWSMAPPSAQNAAAWTLMNIAARLALFVLSVARARRISASRRRRYSPATSFRSERTSRRSACSATR